MKNLKLETGSISAYVSADIEDDIGGFPSEKIGARIYKGSIFLVVEALKSEDCDGVPVIIEQHCGQTRLLIYVDEYGNFLGYPQIITLGG